jgi:hypothetical protein
MRQVDYPGNVRGRFSDAPTPDGLGGTIITASFLNAINFEITNAIKESEIDLNPAQENQLSAAIQKRVDKVKAELNGAIDILNVLNASLRTSIDGINGQLSSLTSSLKWSTLSEAQFDVRLTLPESSRTGNSTGIVTSYRFDGALSDLDVSLATYRLTDTCICQGTPTGSARVQVAGLLPNAVNHCHFILILNAGSPTSAPQFTGSLSFTKSVKTNAAGFAEFTIQEFITLATSVRFSQAPTQLVNLYMTSVSAFGLFREE